MIYLLKPLRPGVVRGVLWEYRAMKIHSSDKPHHEHAQGIVEFALVLPVLLLVMFRSHRSGTNAGNLLFNRNRQPRSSAPGASASGRSPRNVPYYQDCIGMRAAAQPMGILVGINPNNVSISYDHGPNTGNPFGTCPAGTSTSAVTANLGDRVIIQVLAQYNPFLGLVRLPAFPMQSQTARTIIKDVKIKGTPVAFFPTVTPSRTNTPALNQPVVTIISPSSQETRMNLVR